MYNLKVKSKGVAKGSKFSKDGNSSRIEMELFYGDATENAKGLYKNHDNLKQFIPKDEIFNSLWISFIYDWWIE
tara:strand:- start:48 stop:269 length:222 start_codon:yes stop_codon:yes gene_type:complete